MAAVEIEFAQDRFNLFTLLLVSAGPNPFPTLQALGPTRLITKLLWDAPQLGVLPPGIQAPPGTLPARVNLKVSHLSIDELDANPNAPGTTANAVAWLLISARVSPPALAVQVIGIDLDGLAPQRFSPPVDIGLRAFREIAEAGEPTAAAVLFVKEKEIVTIRFVTSPLDNLLATPLNVLADTGNHWAIRLSPEVFTDNVLRTIEEGLHPLPSGTSIEDPAEAAWVERDGAWRVSGSIGVEKEDACPGLFEDVDMSVTIDVLFTPTPDVNAEVLNLTLRLESDVSDWDAFRCWLGSFGILSIGLAFISLPVGFFAGIGTLAEVGSEVGKQAGKEVVETDLGPRFKKVSSDDTTVTYEGKLKLPSVGTIVTATTGPHGLVVSGTVIFLPTDHGVFYTPNAPNLKTGWHPKYNCKEHAWHTSLLIEGVDIVDTAMIGKAFYARVPVTVFPTSSVRPANQWALGLPTVPAIDQHVSISRKSGSPSPLGQTGRAFVHTSAGLRRYDIDPIPLFIPPSDIATSGAEFNCRHLTRNWTRLETMEWLVDPPAWTLGIRPLRQWLLTISEVPVGANITIRRSREGRELGAPIAFTAFRSASQAIEVVTDEATDLQIETTVRTDPEARMAQRWLLPQQVVELGAPARELTRAGDQVAVLTAKGLLVLDLRTGRQTMQTGAIASAEKNDRHPNAVEGQIRRFFDRLKDKTKTLFGKRGEPALPPLSLTLRDGRVAVVWDDKLVIARPWGVP